MNRRLFESFEIEFNIPLKLRFDIFDFPSAQKWASLFSAHLALNSATRKISTSVYLSSQDAMRLKLENSLMKLNGDEDFIDFLRSWRKSPDPLVDEFRSELAIHLDRLARTAQIENSQSEIAKLEETRILFGQTFGTAKLPPRVSFQCAVDLLGWQGIETFSYPMENEDLRHFRNERLPGGVRLVAPPTYRAPIDCAESGEYRAIPQQLNHFSPSFRVDLAKRYPRFEGSEVEKRFHLWKRRTSFDNDNPRSWGNFFYVAQLAKESLDNIDHLALLIQSANEISIEKISFHTVG